MFVGRLFDLLFFFMERNQYIGKGNEAESEKSFTNLLKIVKSKSFFHLGGLVYCPVPICRADNFINSWNYTSRFG